ncbi:hypothetical protein Z517_04921 [Fonsecaea pedrosoi CBS 271.37]|uniref:Unplaced genomic scaffold supercont1.3, whole genome shotgun sequence n=1 Tax=Fonsecaea pedrosoi CBS 271.37 TaxID=1442368 RepID=A0A0D2GTL7_9EURO|nr:uncharacterized protein Z517_04921 [Fonsecaea pedrosoi CBS 271.37]KIW81895.1 hypothetical protein Z517_04921 [Fonsecaea pedrosoi CBS 271.37]
MDDGIVVKPAEIADSDGESDLASPIKRPTAHGVAQVNPLPGLTSDFHIDFDEYLPTQKLSSSASLRPGDFNQLDGSTDVIVAQTATLFGEMKPKKRAHTALHDGLGELQHTRPSENPKVKRSKTYGAASRSRTTSHNDNLFAPPLEYSSEPGYSESTDRDGNAAVQTALGIDTMSPHVVMPVLTDTSNNSGAIPLLERPLADPSHCMTTSMASMGQYQSINLDFRGAGQGLDVNTNPFGSLSQISFLEEPNQAGQENLVNLVEVVEARQTHIDESRGIHEPWQDESLQILSELSPTRPLGTNPARITQTDGTASANGDGLFQVTEITNDMPAPASTRDIPTMPMEKDSVVRKRGRKAKNSRLSSKSSGLDVNDDPDDVGFTILANATRSRRGTMESLSQASQTSATNGSKKRKRRKSNHMGEEAATGDGESSPWKQPTSDMILSDEAAIGLPKEAYKPRPSRSRSKIVVEDETGQQTTESLLINQPTSELNLSDEIMIGLPKEAYKPRPSRARSKKSVDADEAVLPPLAVEDDHHTPAKSNNSVEQETPTVSAAKPSTKKGRKSKVKRAKTSAAALLKKTDPMLSDGEEDVVWMDTKPAPVKLDLPPDLKALKKEPDVPKSEQEHGLGQDGEEAKDAKSNNITIEISNPPEVKDPVVEPKKRGRKPKKLGDQQPEQTTTEGKEEERESHSNSRSPLAEKPRNMRTGVSNDLVEKDLRKAPTVSPITSPEPEAEPEAGKGAVLEEDDTEANTGRGKKAISTPAKPKPAASASSTEKGPTKHSPINPPSFSGSGRKTIYRVGLSRRQNIPSLLRKVDRDKPPPKNVVRKEKESKKKKDMDAENEGEEGGGPGEMRGPDGMLIEWEF